MEPRHNGHQAIVYPVRLDLQYRVSYGKQETITGHGFTEFIGSRQMVFTGDGAIRKGARVQVSLNWPVLLDHRVRLLLVVDGHAAGVEGKQTTVSVEKYDFRTRGHALHAYPAVSQRESDSSIHAPQPFLVAHA